MNTRIFIKRTLVQLHEKCTTDQYGQVSKFNFQPHIFKEREQEVREYCKKHSTLEFSTYGSQFGNYEAFTIRDKEIEKACQEALRNNENYLRNINSY